MRPSCLRCAQISEQFLSWLFTERVMIEQVAHNNKKKMRRCQSDRQAGLFCILTGHWPLAWVTWVHHLRSASLRVWTSPTELRQNSRILFPAFLLRGRVATIKYCTSSFFSFLDFLDLLFTTSWLSYRVERLYCSQDKELKSCQRNECKWRLLLLLRQPCTTSTQGSCSGESQRHTCESRYTRVSFHTHHWG